MATQEALLFATNGLDKGTSVAAVFFDLTEVYDTVPHCQLPRLLVLEYLGLFINGFIIISLTENREYSC